MVTLEGRIGLNLERLVNCALENARNFIQRCYVWIVLNNSGHVSGCNPRTCLVATTAEFAYYNHSACVSNAPSRNKYSSHISAMSHISACTNTSNVHITAHSLFRVICSGWVYARFTVTARAIRVDSIILRTCCWCRPAPSSGLAPCKHSQS